MQDQPHGIGSSGTGRVFGGELQQGRFLAGEFKIADNLDKLRGAANLSEDLKHRIFDSGICFEIDALKAAERFERDGIIRSRAGERKPGESNAQAKRPGPRKQTFMDRVN